jgi:serine/threonine-protein kinase RIO1
MIGHYPLWLVLAVWLLQRIGCGDVIYHQKVYTTEKARIEEMREGLSVPRSRAGRWLLKQVLTWMDRELDALWRLRKAGVIATVEVRLN